MRRLFVIMLISLPVILADGLAWGQETGGKEKLLEPQSLWLPWIVGVGILVLTLMAAFKHPGRTHLD